VPEDLPQRGVLQRSTYKNINNNKRGLTYPVHEDFRDILNSQGGLANTTGPQQHDLVFQHLRERGRGRREREKRSWTNSKQRERKKNGFENGKWN